METYHTATDNTKTDETLKQRRGVFHRYNSFSTSAECKIIFSFSAPPLIFLKHKLKALLKTGGWKRTLSPLQPPTFHRSTAWTQEFRIRLQKSTDRKRNGRVHEKESQMEKSEQPFFSLSSQGNRPKDVLIGGHRSRLTYRKWLLGELMERGLTAAPASVTEAERSAGMLLTRRFLWLVWDASHTDLSI